MDYTLFDDPTLIRLVARQDDNALGFIYDRFSRLVYSMALKIVNNEAVAEEITQDVFFNVWKRAGSYDASQAKVVTWIASIARHRAIDYLRAQKVRPVDYDFSWEEDPALEIAAPLNVEEETELRHRQREVRQALASLPVDQQRTLALAYFGGYSHSEIAEMLKEPLGTVKTRLRLAMQKLRVSLDDENVQVSNKPG